MDELVNELKKHVMGDVRFDKFSRIFYSTDASMYQIDPIGVVIPKDKDDVIAVVKIANENKIPVLPRGAGTSLAGQTVGKALIMDLSRYMDAVLEINEEERWVRVQPGVVLDELNAQLKQYNLMFAPDVATSNRANVGGMMGNNSAGAHSIVYGKTIDHVKEQRVILSNGEEAEFKLLSTDLLQSRMKGESLESRIYREVERIAVQNWDEIIERFPKIMRRVSGYNLDEFVKNGDFNLAKLMVGSEGTLGTVVEAKLNLVPTPKMTAIVVVHFREFMEAMEANWEILQCNPSAVELLDRKVITLTKGTLEYVRRMTFVEGEPEAILIVEFYGETENELIAKIESLESRIRKAGFGYAHVRATGKEEQADVWKVRKAGLGLLLGMKGDKKPIAFVEDTAVDPQRLHEYIGRFREVLDGHGVDVAFYAHASVGCLHVRPIINLKSQVDVDKMRSITETISDLVLEFKGSMSGEHGDGLARSEWNEKIYGPALYQAFQQVKAAFDPKGIMNPGKIVNARPMTENLRYGSNYHATELETHFDFSRENGYAGAVELCNGMGVCLKKTEGTMCPSFMATRDEEHSTRGRANALRAVLSGKLPAGELTGRRLFETLDLCLECKGCKAECPSNVDMAKLKYEFLANYYERNKIPFRVKIFADIEKLNRLGCMFAPMSNWMLNNPAVKWILNKYLGIDGRRRFPPFASQTFTQWLKSRNSSSIKSPDHYGVGKNGTVVLFNDTFMTYNYPEVGRAAIELLEKAGFNVILPEKKCCGRPMISKGMLARAKENAKYNIEQLSKYVEQGYKIVGCEPSCILTFRDDYLDLINDDRASMVAENTFIIDEFLQTLHLKGQLELEFNQIVKKIMFHGHCHQKALVGTEPSLHVLRLPAGYEVREINSGCCGMAGSFGYESEHYDVSLEVGKRLFDEINLNGSEVEVVADGISCRQQIEHATGRKARHLVEVLLDAL